MPKKRYVAQVSFYVYADSDDDAKAQCQKLTDQIKEHDDNWCSTDSLIERPQGSLETREVKL